MKPVPVGVFVEITLVCDAAPDGVGELEPLV